MDLCPRQVEKSSGAAYGDGAHQATRKQPTALRNPEIRNTISARPTPTATQHLPTSVMHQQTSNLISTTHFDTNVTCVKSPTRTVTRDVVHTSGENGFSCELQVVKRTSLLEKRRKQVNGGKLTQLASGLHTRSHHPQEICTKSPHKSNKETPPHHKPHKSYCHQQANVDETKNARTQTALPPSNFFDITLAFRGGM